MFRHFHVPAYPGKPPGTGGGGSTPQTCSGIKDHRWRIGRWGRIRAAQVKGGWARQRVPGSDLLYQVETVIEKPTPTEAEQKLVVPGLRAGNYLCFFGLHVLPPTVMEILARQLADGRADLSAALSEISSRERYLAHELLGRRLDIDLHYGLLSAQIALGLAGKDRDEVLSLLVEQLVQSQA